MANQRKLIGRLPVFKGEWSSLETYNKLNEVTLYGSSFRSKIDGNTYKPAELNEEGTGMTVNENWYVVANGTDAYLAGEKIASIDGNTSTYNVSRFHQHTGFWEAVEYDESEPAYLEAQEYTAGHRVNLVNYTNHTFVAMKDMTGVMPDYNNISNKFTLEEAILFVPSKYRLTGMNVGFLDSSNKPVVHKHKGGTFTEVANWEEDIQTQLTELSSKSTQMIITDTYNSEYSITRDINFRINKNEKIYIEAEVDALVDNLISSVINNNDGSEGAFTFKLSQGKAFYEYTPDKDGILNLLGVKYAENVNFEKIQYRIVRSNPVIDTQQKSISEINNTIENKSFKGTFNAKVPPENGYYLPNIYAAQNTEWPIYRNAKNTVVYREGGSVYVDCMEDDDLLYGQGINVTDSYTKEHRTTDIAVRIKKGIKYNIEFITSDLDNTNYINTNILYESRTDSSKTIGVVNGKGHLEFTAEEDGAIGTFGYGRADKVLNNADVIYNVHIASGLKDEINTIVNNEAKIFKKALFTRSITCDYGPDKPNSYALNVAYKKGQIVVIQISTDSEETIHIAGNPATSTGSYPNIDISISTSPIEVKYTFAEDGVLGKFGKKEPYDSNFTVTYVVSVYSDSQSLEERVENLEESFSYKAYDGIRDVTSFPIEEQMIYREVGYVPIIREWGFISDSLGSGEMECFTKEGEKEYIDLYDYSWGQQICRLCGSNGYNFSKGGMQVKTWLETDSERCWKGASKNPKQAYICTLGINDSSKGQTTVGNISTDVDISNCENNADTFAGNYAKLIYKLRTVSPRSVIFLVTLPKPGVEEWNDVIRNLSTLFDRVYVIDIEYLKDLYYNNSDFRKKYYMNGHMNPMGYLYHAYVLMKHIDYIMQTNAENFIDIALWNTEYVPSAP